METQNQNSLIYLLHFMLRYPWRSGIMLASMLFAGIAEGISIISILPMLDFASNHVNSDKSKAVEIIEASLALINLKPSLGAFLSILVIGMLIKGCFLFLAMKQVGYTVAYVISDMRRELISSVLKAKWEYFIHQPAGNFANAISSETDRNASAYQHAISSLAAIIQASVYWFAALSISWEMSLFTLVISVILYLLLKGLINISRLAGQQQTTLMKSLIIRLTDALQAIKPIKAMALESRFQPLLEKEINELNISQQRHVMASETLRRIHEPILVSIIAIGIYLAVSYGEQSFSSLLVMAFLFYRLAGQAFIIQSCIQEVRMNESAMVSLQQCIKNASDAEEHLPQDLLQPELKNNITFESVSFHYGEKKVLSDLSFEIPVSKLTAIHGPSGTGKTTVVDLISGLLTPKKGTISIDGQPLLKYNLKKWRESIGYVPQEVFLFHDTILHNITLGAPGITPEQVKIALKDADILDFVESLPNGLETIVGERGSKLSGGQRQRLSIARALVRQPKLLVLDEVTTSLDKLTEIAICDTFSKLKNKMTIVAISHQTAILKVADISYHLQNGHIEKNRKETVQL